MVAGRWVLRSGRPLVAASPHCPPLQSRPPLRPHLRALSTSSPLLTRFRTTTPSPLREIGLVLPRSDAPYECGQLFVHRVFGYKGVILCAFRCKLNEKKESTTEARTDISCTSDFQYQVLIHRLDWPHMGFPVDMTSYLADGNLPSRGEKLHTTMNGLDCVSHADILPFAGTERSPIDHDLFDRLFAPIDDAPSAAAIRYQLRPEIRQTYMTSTKSWMAPIHINREVTDGIEVTVTTFYLGVNVVSGQQKHVWRYVIRLNNQTQHDVTLRERLIKVFAGNSMHQLNGHGVVGKQPTLTATHPAFQFSSNIELSQSRGGHMWGVFKMERATGATFDVAIPMFTLDAAVSEAAITPWPQQAPPSPAPVKPGPDPE